MSALVTLRDGSKVMESTYITIDMSVTQAIEEGLYVLFELVEKCKNADYQFLTTTYSNPKPILEKHRLIGLNEIIHDDVRRVVLNCIEGAGLSIRWAPGHVVCSMPF